MTKQFPGTLALDNVSFELREGEIHALVGENGAGKSTLMNIISGIMKHDSGELYIEGKLCNFDSVTQSMEFGVGYVHQEQVLCPSISVAENIFLGQKIVKKSGAVDYKRMYRETNELIQKFGLSIDPTVKLNRLSVSNQQVVEIARALARNCKILIFDEPTSSLTERETETLFDIIHGLKEKGISILYISHRMSEIFRVCDRVTVLRDGVRVDTLDVADTTPEKIVNMMVGRELTQIFPHKDSEPGDLLLKVEDYSSKGRFKDISFELKKGEVLGIAGLVGAGRSEILKAICAIDKPDTGKLYYNGALVKFNSYRQAIDAGIVYLTEDRKMEGLFLNLSLEKNLSVANLKLAMKRNLLNSKAEAKLADESIKKLDIRTSSIRKLVRVLSGGNQQKAVFAKWLLCEPKIIFLDEPTRGIDVGAKREIYHIIRKLVNDGVGVVMISSELSEIIGMCDRVLVMHEGKINGEISGSDITEQKIITFASGLNLSEVQAKAI